MKKVQLFIIALCVSCCCASVTTREGMYFVAEIIYYRPTVYFIALRYRPNNLFILSR